MRPVRMLPVAAALLALAALPSTAAAALNPQGMTLTPGCIANWQQPVAFEAGGFPSGIAPFEMSFGHPQAPVALSDLAYRGQETGVWTGTARITRALADGQYEVDLVSALTSTTGVVSVGLLKIGGRPGADRTPPVLALPAKIEVDATGPDGARVSYSATASDETDGAVATRCAPASGATFPIGATTVSCSATDAAGNRATGSFGVTVRGAREQLAILRRQTAGLVPALVPIKPLLALELRLADRMLDRGHRRIACLLLRVFSLHSARYAGPVRGRQLADGAKRIRAVLACR